MKEPKMLTLHVNDEIDADIQVIEYDGQRVVTFEQIDTLHARPEGTAKKAFSRNRGHFIEGKDYYVFEGENGRKALSDADCPLNGPPRRKPKI